jgi:hypothetical protein
MSESTQNKELEEARQEYLELSRRQTGSINWTPEDRVRLQTLKDQFDIDQPPLTEAEKEALHRQGAAGAVFLGTKQEPQPELTTAERELVVGVHARTSKTSRG